MKAVLPLPKAGRIMAAVALTVMVAACGGTATTGSAAQSAPAPTASAAPCDIQSLRIIIDPSSARSVAGGTYIPMDFANDSVSTTCELKGYPPTSALTGGKGPGSSALAAELKGVVLPVIIAPNYTAHAWVFIATASGADTAGCRKFTAKGFRVFMPHSTTHAWLSYPFSTCAPVHQSIISVGPMLQGLANPAVFP